MKLAKYWEVFRETRFTKTDLWRAFGRGYHGFPDDEWISSIGLFENEDIIECKGPRGGLGWKLSERGVKKMKSRDDRIAKEKKRITNLIESTNVKIGELSYQGGRLEWKYWPKQFVPGTIKRRYFKHRVGNGFFASWPKSISKKKLQADLDNIFLEIQRLTKAHQASLKDELAELEILLSELRSRNG